MLVWVTVTHIKVTIYAGLGDCDPYSGHKSASRA